jgi:hypothetical protein
VTDDHFVNNYLAVECLAHYESYLMGKEELNLAKASNPVSGGGSRYDHDNPNPQM